MLKEQFYIRLILNIIIGIMFAYALVKMAGHNNHEQGLKPHKILHIFGWIFIGLSVICLAACIYYLTLIDFPSKIVGPFIGPNTIVRSSSATFYWGYPTMIQNSVLTMAMGTFDNLGFGGYFLYFKGSNSSWWKKFLKFFTVIFLYAFMASATNFHYFDFPELVSPTLFIILWLIIINRKSKASEKIQAIRTIESLNSLNNNTRTEYDNENIHLLITENNNSIFTNNNVTVNSQLEVKIDKEDDEMSTEENIKIIKDDNLIIFCRYCGKKIESDSIFCKYCGRTIFGPNIRKKIMFSAKRLYAWIKAFISHTKKNSASNSLQNVSFKFSNNIKICLITEFCIVIGIAALCIYLFKYNRERSLGNSYNIAISISFVGIVSTLLTWILCFKQNKFFKLWRKYVMRFCFSISLIISLISLWCIIVTLTSYKLKEAKNVYSHDQALKSDDINILNSELNRRGIKAPFGILQEQAQKNNGMAQGILGEYYFYRGRDQIKESKQYKKVNQNLHNAGINNIERAFYWWKRASENEDARGLYRIGNCYANIIKIEGISKDLNLAYQYWIKAAEKGCGMAYKRLGDLFGTWDYLRGFQIQLNYDPNSEPIIRGFDVTEEGSESFPLPKEWKHDISIAREYWQKAVDCGGIAAEEARCCLERVYLEEKRSTN